MQAAVSHPGLYHYLPTYSLEKEKSTLQKGTGFIIAYNSEIIYWRILHWWDLCALEEKCIAPPGPRLSCGHWQRCVRNHTAICWNKCPRYDGSALNVLYSNYLYEINQTDGLPPLYNRPFAVSRRPTSLFELRQRECHI